MKTISAVLLGLLGVKALLTFIGLRVVRLRRPLKPGESVPKAHTMDQDGRELDLATALAADRWHVVYFYPKAGTPGCTKQACSLRNAFAELSDSGITVYGVSAERPAALKAFRQKQRLPFTLLADADGRVAEAFGVSRVLGISRRETYLVRSGKVIWRDLSASTDRQAEGILAAIGELERESV